MDFMDEGKLANALKPSTQGASHSSLIELALPEA